MLNQKRDRANKEFVKTAKRIKVKGHKTGRAVCVFVYHLL
jgi:hypothetical protein